MPLFGFMRSTRGPEIEASSTEDAADDEMKAAKAADGAADAVVDSPTEEAVAEVAMRIPSPGIDSEQFEAENKGTESDVDEPSAKLRRQLPREEEIETVWHDDDGRPYITYTDELTTKLGQEARSSGILLINEQGEQVEEAVKESEQIQQVAAKEAEIQHVQMPA